MDSCGIFQYTEYGMSIPKEPLKCFTNEEAYLGCLGYSYIIMYE